MMREEPKRTLQMAMVMVFVPALPVASLTSTSVFVGRAELRTTDLAEEVFGLVGRDPLIDVAVALEKAARADDFFIKRKLYPNVDFYSGLVYRAMGMALARPWS